jgi:hypothetical protein
MGLTSLIGQEESNESKAAGIAPTSPPIILLHRKLSLPARIVVTKVEEDQKRLTAILRNIPVVQKDPNWICRSCIASALAELTKDGRAVGTSQLECENVEMTARQCVAQRAAARRYQRAEKALLLKPA